MGFVRNAALVGLISAAGVIFMVPKLESNVDEPCHGSLNISQLQPKLKEWWEKGHLVQVYGNQMFVIDTQSLPPENDELVEPPALVFLHGFPTSSYDYHRAFERLLKLKRRLVFFDHVGFGFSDKPQHDYEFTIHDHAENALELMQILNIKSAHIVAHDMGDSVLTEILSRRHLRLLPARFTKDFFKSVTFTNGGMRYELINQRLGQRLLTLPFIGSWLAALSCRAPVVWAQTAHKQQISSIYSPTADQALLAEDAEAMFDLQRLNGGQRLVDKTVSYLLDRRRFESRWYRALRHLDIPCMLLWGDSDAVAPMEIAKYLASNVLPSRHFTGKYLQNVGHFLMLEKPEEWAKTVAQFMLEHE